MTTAVSGAPMSGKVALVTGASRGIGAEIAAALASAGAHVVLAARDNAGLSRRVSAISAAGGKAVALPVDVANEDSVKALLAQIQDRFGRLDAAVNNAAGGGRIPEPLAEWASEEFDSAISVNLRGVFLCLKFEIGLMLASGNGGAIVNMSSTAGEQGVAGMSGYVASKFAVGGLTRVAALD
jgi:NAD(P)-dependent dehydrogenase (short-subunit alcohol dehydrogenase family)